MTIIMVLVDVIQRCFRNVSQFPIFLSPISCVAVFYDLVFCVFQ